MPYDASARPDQLADLLAFLLRPRRGIFLMGDCTVELGVPPQLLLGLGGERGTSSRCWSATWESS